MRWADERYIRLYTRDTADWVALGWEAQSLLALTMRKVDRAGILDLGKAGTRGLAALVTMPLEVVARALPILLEDGCVVMNGTVLVLPNFIEAQEANQTDAQRKREQRARDRDLASAGVTKRDEKSQNVTTPDGPPPVLSRLVTPNCAVPSLAVPSSSRGSGHPVADAFRQAISDSMARVPQYPVGGVEDETWRSLEASLRDVPVFEAVELCRDLVLNHPKDKRPPGNLAYFAQALANEAIARRNKPKGNGLREFIGLDADGKAQYAEAK